MPLTLWVTFALSCWGLGSSPGADLTMAPLARLMSSGFALSVQPGASGLSSPTLTSMLALLGAQIELGLWF